jgi:hypothetical protein
VLDHITFGSRVNNVRITEIINGRPLLIEVSAVGHTRWRAQIASSPGGITALMPFYGPTAEEAADRLKAWVARTSLPAGPKRTSSRT